MRQKKKLWWSDVALLAALLLLVQTLLTGLATGARADVLSENFGVICSSDGLLHPGGDRETGGSGHLPDCCSFGCPMVGGALPPPALPPLGLAVYRPTLRVLTPSASAHPARAELSPVLSRAPPRV